MKPAHFQMHVTQPLSITVKLNSLCSFMYFIHVYCLCASQVLYSIDLQLVVGLWQAKNDVTNSEALDSQDDPLSLILPLEQKDVTLGMV